MALLKALNDSCRHDVELQRQKYQLRRAEVKSNKALLKRKVKAELSRPGTLAAAFTLGVLVAPEGKRGKDAKREDRTDKRSVPHQAAQAESGPEPEVAGKKPKSKHFDPVDVFSSIISAVVVRLATNWVIGLGGSTAEKMQDADVDSSTRVEL